MIKNNDRSKWFGASDTSIIMGNWDTYTFQKWWGIKLGLYSDAYSSWAMKCGNILEIPIIKKICEVENLKINIGKRPYYKRKYRLRCNFDGYTKQDVIEIKTTNKGFNNVPKNYWQQCQVLMYRKKKSITNLYAYKMCDDDYLNPYFPNIDYKRITKYEIKYDNDFINNEYLPRIKYLAKCLKHKKMPYKEEYEKSNRAN